jgi:hypothetical protein
VIKTCIYFGQEKHGPSSKQLAAECRVETGTNCSAFSNIDLILAHYLTKTRPGRASKHCDGENLWMDVVQTCLSN